MPQEIYPAKIRAAVARKRCLWHSCRSQPYDKDTADKYHVAEDKCRRLIREFELKKEREVVGSKNLGRFYKFVNARLANKQGVGTLKNRGGQAVTNDTDRANLLNEYFCSVSVPDNGIVLNFSDKSGSGKLDSVVFSRNVVMKAIKKLKPNLSAGPDGYPPDVN